MNYVKTENLIAEQKKTTDKEKQKQSLDKKKNNKIKFKFSKNKFKPLCIQPKYDEPPAINITTEWQSTIKGILIKLLSLPAMSDREEFEKSLNNSNDINWTIDQLPLFYYSRILPYWATGLLSYGSLYAKTKTNKLCRITNVDNINEKKSIVEENKKDTNEFNFKFKKINPENNI